MAQDLKGYDGAVNGIKIRHGVTVASHGIAVGQEKQATGHTPQEEDMEQVVQRAIEVIGDREDAMRWLGTPVRALDYATPVSRLHDAVGREQVLSVLTQLERGVL